MPNGNKVKHSIGHLGKGQVPWEGKVWGHQWAWLRRQVAMDTSQLERTCAEACDQVTRVLKACSSLRAPLYAGIAHGKTDCDAGWQTPRSQGKGGIRGLKTGLWGAVVSVSELARPCDSRKFFSVVELLAGLGDTPGLGSPTGPGSPSAAGTPSS